MTDIVAFLTARLDEDETTAFEAQDGCKGDLKWHSEGSAEVVTEPCANMVATCCSHGPVNGVAAHVARHDPARVLADVGVKRELIQLHKQGDVLVTDSETEEPVGFKCDNCDPLAETWPCETLRLLAWPYADHPDYDQSWQPFPLYFDPTPPAAREKP